MLLGQVRNYMRIKGQASLDEIAVALNLDKSLVSNLVEQWVRRGYMKEQDAVNCGSICAQCHCQKYVWIESSSSPVKL